ncbi:MAG: MGMT family protein [Candidatus Micrarchaeota archaeon]|nr:MGMT family protein [Candidatus Micrarchaeota archaeon]
MKAAKAKELLGKYDLTSFQKEVLIATAAIPKGETRTYKQIAAAVHRPHAYRAVGSVMRINPLAPTIPCHRVVKSDGSLGDYSGRGGTKTKERMLRQEGALARA